MKKHSCSICRKALNGGIIVNGTRICKSCEARLINTHVETDFYTYYKNCIRKTIVTSLIRKADTNCQNYHL